MGPADPELQITVCIATRNRWKLLPAALSSVLEQAGTVPEVIVVDDASCTVPPQSLLSLMNHAGVRYVRHPQHRGLAAARNMAIRMARGAYFAFCDDDDTWPPHLLNALLAEMLSADGVRATIGIHGNESQCARLGRHHRISGLFRAGITPPVSSQLYRTDLLRGIGGYDERIRAGVDHDLWVRLLDPDPVVAVSWGSGANVNNDPLRSQITNNEDQRRRAIEEALQIWRPSIEKTLGVAFYEHFLSEYRRYLNYDFFKKAIRRGQYLSAIRRITEKGVCQRVAAGLFARLTGIEHCGPMRRVRP